MNRPSKTTGMRHVALCVSDLAACEYFYVELMAMTVEWRPDADNVYLTSGNDNLALHKDTREFNGAQRLDHIGFIIETADEVDLWYDFLVSKEIKILKDPKTHRDGARSFYCADPDGNTVQIIYHPPIAKMA
ncbi:Putative ring-cleaving dioxygenase [hydrothermal vent metagenome]|uniref:Ring-cleaving dioxygenase n=1 Tax=hydrothermal vent metagenome TaxID=652676 RepID=A0A3B1ASP4_9ZZZZ